MVRIVILTNHIKERYVERIVGIKDHNEIKRYVAQNESIIIEHIEKMYEHSMFVHKGSIGTEKEVRRYYISDNIALVVAEDEECLITLFKIDFHFPSEINQKVIKGLVNEIQELNQKKEKQIAFMQKEINDLKEQHNRINTEINFLKEQMQILEGSKKLLLDEITDKNNQIRLIDKEINKYAHQLFNWMDYKKDLKKIS